MVRRGMVLGMVKNKMMIGMGRWRGMVRGMVRNKGIWMGKVRRGLVVSKRKARCVMAEEKLNGGISEMMGRRRGRGRKRMKEMRLW